MKAVRLRDPDEGGNAYLNLWDLVKGAKTKEEYLAACRGAIATICASWREQYLEWEKQLEGMRGPPPVLLVVATRAPSASWLFEHLTRDYELLHNPDDDDRHTWVTIQIDSKVFEAEKGRQAVLREMVNTVGQQGRPGEHVRCIVSVGMLAEGWDVKNVTPMPGIRAFGSPLLTEQVIGAASSNSRPRSSNGSKRSTTRPVDTPPTECSAPSTTRTPTRHDHQTHPVRKNGGTSGWPSANASTRCSTNGGVALGIWGARRALGRRISSPNRSARARQR